MAKVIEKEKEFSNETEIKSYRSTALVFYGISIFFFILGAANMRSTLDNGTSVLMMALFLIPGGIGGYFWNKKSAFASGNKGEKKAFQYLMTLSDEYSIMHNVNLCMDDKRTELDIVVISRYGIQVIEVKNHNGEIVGDKDATIWKQKKVGVRGGRYTSDMKNPLKQLGFQKYLLSDVLKKNNVRAWVDGYVLMPSTLSLEVNSDLVYASEHDLLRKLKLQTEVKLDEEKIQKIIHLLMD